MIKIIWISHVFGVFLISIKEEQTIIESIGN